ncbi:patatin-like phospholipase family protein [Jannaschia marina]|uniref:patatin-like phospholipase family protein n=1 Tax=Jannaschia marina TaxID=2741674 RepID=UPI0015C94191|nr:patatin-like phospholipase family protein [Jannaschia marina]
MALPLPYDQLVFSGGGLRCFWHGGFLSEVTAAHPLRPARVTGSSGGALGAAAWIAGRAEHLRDVFRDALGRTDRNVTADDLDDEAGRTVHQRVYTEVIEATLDDAALARIADGPAFQVNVSTPGNCDLPTLRALVGGTIYQVEQLFAPTPRPRLSAIAGMEQRLIDGRAAARTGQLPGLVRMAATVPPAFRPGTWDGEPLYDGGMVDKAPLPDPDAGPTLVLLTKRFTALPDDDGGRITYVQPSETPLKGRKLDFTDPDLVKEAWTLGAKDGSRWRNEIT